jgi:hypothetical protein
MNWISVKERLPEYEVDVLLFDDWKSNDGKIYKDVRVGYLREVITRKGSDGIYNTCEWGGTEYAFNITHWMPLPEPPKQ